MSQSLKPVSLQKQLSDLPVEEPTNPLKPISLPEKEVAMNNQSIDSLVEQKSSQKESSQEELDRVRELLLGPDQVQQRLRGAEVSRLREIIFGEQMQEYERHFTDLQRRMERVLADLRQMQDRLGEFEKTQLQRTDTLEREMLQSNEELRREVSRLRSHETIIQQLHTQVRQQELLGQTVQEQASELHKATSQQEVNLRSLIATVEENRIQQDRKLDSLKREARQDADNLLTELRRVTDRLNIQKTDRKALASMLIEIATRLETGSNMANLLEGLAGSSQE